MTFFSGKEKKEYVSLIGKMILDLYDLNPGKIIDNLILKKLKVIYLVLMAYILTLWLVLK